MKNKEASKEIFFILILLFLIPTVSADFFSFLDFFKITGRATTGAADLNITIGNTAPIIVKVQNVTVITPTITEASSKQFVFNFTAEDLDGTGDLVSTKAMGQINRTGEDTRYNLSCLAKTNLSTTRTEFECTVPIWYFDAPEIWTINATIQDRSGATALNISVNLTIKSTLGIAMGPTSLTWPAVQINSLNTTATNDPIIINNTGNQNVSLANVKVQALDLPGETTPTIFLNASNFTVSGTTGTTNLECIGTRLVNNSATGITGLGMTKGNNTINSYNYSSGQAPLYFCLAEVTSGVTQQSYSTGGATWTISVV